MKHILTTVIFLCLTVLSLQAQDRFSFSLEMAAGAGVVRGPLVTVTPQFVTAYDLGRGFRAGAGVGMRFAAPCLQYIIQDERVSRRFCREMDVPLFVRLGYGKDRFFTNLDTGYAFSIISFFGAGWEPGGKKDPCYNGLFFEPQAGWKIGRRSSLALGLLLQHSVVKDHLHTEYGDLGSSSYYTSVQVTTKKPFTPAFTLRYGLEF